MKKFKFSVHDLLNNNKFIMLISVIIAICIWITVSPQRDLTINCPVVFSTKNSAAERLGLEIISEKEHNISVKVSGEWYAISELTADDITISYSLSNIVDSGDYEIAITATKTNSNASFTIKSVAPEKITVSMDHISTVKFPVEVITNNITTQDDLIVGTPIIENERNEIEITGPALQLKKIKRVVAEVDVEGKLTKSQVFNTELKFLNKNDKAVDVSKLNLPFSEVDVIVPINQTKVVPIKATFVNLPEAYVSYPISHTLSEENLEILGTTEALSKIDSITLDAIDYRLLTPDNNVFVIPLKLPSGVTATNGATEITVKISMRDYKQKTLNVSRFRTVNVQNGTTAKVETTYKSVVVVGPEDVIDNLSATDIYIECDLSKNANNDGSVLVQGTIKSDKYKTIWGAGEIDITVKVENE